MVRSESESLSEVIDLVKIHWEVGDQIVQLGNIAAPHRAGESHNLVRG